jgi:uncharacterized protein (TIGR03437 family)
MKTTNFAFIALLLTAAALPALADLNGSATIAAGGSFSLDTGTNVASGGDISFTGTSITFAGNAKGIVLKGFTGSALYPNVTETILAVFIITPGAFSSTPIPATSLEAGTASGTIIGMETNGSNPAKFLITALSGSSISIQYTTYQSAASGGGANAPTISAVMNNSSMIPSGFPNSGIAPSSLFVIQGAGMATPGTTPVLQDSTQGLPTTLNGASISVSAGGKTVTPAIWYSSPTAIAAVLPAATPVGAATLTVSYNGTASAPFSFTVVASAFGIDNYSGNTAVVQDPLSATGAVFTPTSSAKPGQLVTVWGTGLGADPADSDNTYTSTPHPVSTPVQVYVGGVPATDVTFAGASVYPGVSVIQFEIPQGVPNGCYVPVVIVTGTGANINVSNTPTFAIMDAGGVCSEPLYGISGSTITTTINEKSGEVFIGQLNEGAAGNYNLAEAVFDGVSGTVTTSGGSSSGIVSIGACIMTESSAASSGGTGTSTLTVTYLDAGTITVQGPVGTYPLTEISKGSYDSQLAASAIPSTGGAFVFTGSGGADVGAFTATVNLPNPILTWTNQSAAATITRSQGLQVNWVGGGPGTYVYISGASEGNGVSGGFSCYAPQSALQFTVPAYVLSVLPAGPGSVQLENLTTYTTFSAPGLNSAFGFGFTGVSITSTYQ